MSGRLKKEGAFLRFIVTTENKSQFNCILELLTFRQARLISEICFNVLRGSFSNSDLLAKKLKKPLITFLQQLGSPQKGSLKQKDKILLIREKKDQLFNLFRHIRADLLKLLDHYQKDD